MKIIRGFVQARWYRPPKFTVLAHGPNKLFQIVQQYPDADIMLAGDFNARVVMIIRIFYIMMNQTLFFQNEAMYESDLFELPKKSKDLNHNSFGLSLIELCKTYGIHILNGRSPGDRDGEITCVANDGCSIVDYFIVSSSLFPLVSKFEIVNRSESVHLPLSCCLSFNISEQSDRCEVGNEETSKYFKKFK